MTDSPQQTIVVAGASGVIGRSLVAALMKDGRDVAVITRNPDAVRSRFDPAIRLISWSESLDTALREAAAVINLSGENIAAGRWTEKRKAAIRDSRVQTTRRLAGVLLGIEHPPALINASAAGFYGSRGTDPVNEDTPSGDGFLADICRQWEAEADHVADHARLVKVRIGIALTPEGGALKAMLPPFRMGLGGPIGSGRQGMSWIHIEDVVGIFLQAALNASWSGVVNATAPEPVDNRTFVRTLGRVLRRPAVLPVPGFVLRTVLGEMADYLLLQGQFVAPDRTRDLGYTFRYPSLEPALRHLLSR